VSKGLSSRLLWLTATAGLLLALVWLDHNRGGPATLLTRCNFLLSRSAAPPADVLIIGSSRSGTALDPLAMQSMLSRALGEPAFGVERMALGNGSLRASHTLLENYLDTRGAPRAVVLELAVMTRRTVDHLAENRFAEQPEDYVFRRDLNLMTFGQILRLPSVAMPFSESEGAINRWRYRLRGVVLRAGALVYQALHAPTAVWDFAACDEAAMTREPNFPDDFAFSYGEFEPDALPREVVGKLESVLARVAAKRRLEPWQAGIRTGQRYPYHFAEPYRRGEVTLLHSMLDLASRRGVPVVLLPLPLYGYVAGAEDMQWLADSITTEAHVFDLYGHVGGKLDKFWYDDGHIEVDPAGKLTTAVLADHLLESGLLVPRVPGK
jgi:hypothetical protein